ncbi:MAG: helix-turn-helix domain-containing protein [Clostridia bacterium]|nr:helix-turn-helix domain-containing protein [Clostridia bacterium]
MVNEFGKLLRKIRIDNGEILKDMADKLEMTSSYLSAIECGKRNIPNNLIPRLEKIYNLDNRMVLELQEAKQKSISKIEINALSEMSNQKRDLALEFARKFDNIDDEFAKKLMDFMKRHQD